MRACARICWTGVCVDCTRGNVWKCASACAVENPRPPFGAPLGLRVRVVLCACNFTTSLLRHLHTHTRTHTHAHTRTRTHTHARARIHTAGGTTRFVFVIPPAQRYQHNFSSRPDGGGGGVPQASIEPLEGGPVALAEASVKLLQGPVDERSVRPLVCMRGRVCLSLIHI